MSGIECQKQQVLATGKSKLDAFLSPVETFMIGGVAAAISKTLAAPIERVKLLLQNQGESAAAKAQVRHSNLRGMRTLALNVLLIPISDSCAPNASVEWFH